MVEFEILFSNSKLTSHYRTNKNLFQEHKTLNYEKKT